MHLVICLECGTAHDAEAWFCHGCGGERVDVIQASDAGLAAADQAWLDGRIDDHVYEATRAAIEAAIAGVNDAWSEAEASDGVGALPDIYQALAAAVEPAPTEPAPAPVKLRVRTVTYQEMVEHITLHHRHHKPPRFWRFGLGVEDESGTLRGVIVVGNPKSRVIQQTQPGTLEVTRCSVIPGTPNGVTMLYAAACKAARSLKDPTTGRYLYDKLITYILESESGTSLRAASWELEAFVRGKTWHSKNRPRVDKAPTCNKTRWVKRLRAPRRPLEEVA